MKGLEKYIAKNGKHFTEKLALSVVESRWKLSDIINSSETIVYYNVSEATQGDLIYLVNTYYKNTHSSKRRCVKEALKVVEDVNANGYAFSSWHSENIYFDFTEYL